MKISLNWIKDYIPGLKIGSFDEFKQRMIEIGLDIESIESEREKYENFVVGEVEEVSKHPDADKLVLCKVDVGNKTLDIVCGAPNIEKGQKVCVALVGAVIPNGGFEIKKTKIRGVPSEGMICAEDELEISEDHTVIMVLDPKAKIGQEFADYIKASDYIIDIGVTANRGDQFSHIGMAREIAAIYDKKIKLPEIKIKESKEKSCNYIKISIESKDFCKRFTGRVIKNVKIGESPEWLKKKLTSIGLRPRNNIVDITNYVMMETGQPLHAFDYDEIRGKEIIVRTAKEGDKFTTLDSKERILNDRSLMVCDADGYSAIAGVMGGEFSEITDGTKKVFIESAYFDPVCIRKNSKKLGLQTDASQRFERGVDIEKVEYASHRAAQLMNELADGEVLKGLVDVYPEKFKKLQVGMRTERASKLIGIEFDEKQVIDLLDKIEIKFVEKKDGKLMFDIPEFRRNDLMREVDLIEEVTRLYGYEKLDNQLSFNMDISSHVDYGIKNRKLVNKTREHFIGRGFNEIITESQLDRDKLKYFSDKIVKIENPISLEMDGMRVNLFYGMLRVIKNNINYSGKGVSLKLFEIGNVFEDAVDNFKEENRLSLALSGKRDKMSFNEPDVYFDIYDLKGELEMFLSKLNLDNLVLFCYNDKENNIVVDLIIGNLLIGKVNKVSNEMLNLFDIEQDIYFSEIYLDVLYKKVDTSKFYKEISKFPVAKRDLAIVTRKDISYKDIRELIINSGGEFLRSVKLFDIYSDKQLGSNKKSMAFSLEFLSDKSTLTDDEVNQSVNKIVKTLEKKLGITLRE
ncbi:phenylalanine--tRNA ligase subunit beta [Bacteroidota bacterium]